MNLQMGSQRFRDVQIPLLWGERAIVQDRKGRLSIIDLSGSNARLEILADEPAPGVSFRPRVDGIVILRNGEELYSYNSKDKLMSPITLKLPECQITPWSTRVGTNQFSGNFISGFGVGIAVTENGIAVGAPLPAGLAKLAV
jgi:hypothetical protein